MGCPVRSGPTFQHFPLAAAEPFARSVALSESGSGGPDGGVEEGRRGAGRGLSRGRWRLGRCRA